MWYVYVSYIKIVLHFISILHIILKKSMRDFYFLKVFYSLVKSETAKRPDY